MCEYFLVVSILDLRLVCERVWVLLLLAMRQPHTPPNPIRIKIQTQGQTRNKIENGNDSGTNIKGKWRKLINKKYWKRKLSSLTTMWMYKNTKAKTICNTETPRSTITRLIRFLDCVLHLLYGSAPPKIPSCGNGRILRSCHFYAGSFRTKKYIYIQTK